MKLAKDAKTKLLVQIESFEKLSEIINNNDSNDLKEKLVKNEQEISKVKELLTIVQEKISNFKNKK